MTVPKTSMHKNHCAQAGKYNIGFSGQVIALQAKPETLPMKQTSNQQFWFGVATAYT
jgi:hypothetical protein